MLSNRKKKKNNGTSQKILETAADIFAEVGFAGARVDEIAKLAGVNKATIYYHIGDKEALYAEVLHNIFENIAERINKEIVKADTPEQKLKTYIRQLSKTVDTHPQMASIMLRELASGGKDIPVVVTRDLTGMLEDLICILDEGEKKGVFIKTSPFVVQMMIIGAIAFYKTSSPFRSRLPDLPELDMNVTGKVSDEIEKLVIKALKK